MNISFFLFRAATVRIYLSMGTFVDIRQPELTHFKHTMLSLGLPIEGDNQRFLEIASIHIVWIEVLLPAL